MTIIFGYFQYLSELYILSGFIPMVISAVFFIIINYFIIRSSRTQPEDKVRPELLYYIALINIIFLIIPFGIPTISLISPNEIETVLGYIYQIFFGLIQSVPFFITYGILMYKFGKLNESRFNRYLKISGIIWILSNGVNIITLDGTIYSILFEFITFSALTFNILMIVLAIFGFIDLGGWILLIFHSVLNKDNNLLIAGIFRLVLFGVSYIYSIFIPLLLGFQI